MNKILFLKQIPCMQPCWHHHIQRLADSLKTKKFVRNAVIYKEGTEVHSVWLVLQGEFVLEKNLPGN